MFALVVQLTGIMLYGYCLGVIAATLTNAASFRSVVVNKLINSGFMYMYVIAHAPGLHGMCVCVCL